MATLPEASPRAPRAPPRRTACRTPPAAQAGPGFDAEAATQAWLASVPDSARTASDAYFEGGYWLQLWNVLLACAVYLALLATGASRWMRELAERVSRFRSVHVAAYAAQFTVATTVLSFPLTVYQGFFREHQYGLATQTFGAWMGDQLKGLLLGLVFSVAFLVLVFAALDRGSSWALARRGGRWGVRGMDDPAGLPLLALVVTLVFFVLTPVTNTYIRIQEQESDVFGLNAARRPDGMAAVSLKLGEYRKLSPGPIEEMIFFDHPSGRTRILTAMRWKAENLADGR